MAHIASARKPHIHCFSLIKWLSPMSLFLGFNSPPGPAPEERASKYFENKMIYENSTANVTEIYSECVSKVYI